MRLIRSPEKGRPLAEFTPAASVAYAARMVATAAWTRSRLVPAGVSLEV